jgi:Family of unknown function (DUF5689)/Domain of unknown function (DUF5017)
MNTFFKTTVKAMMVLAVGAVITTSCNKRFDEPPVYVAPSITATTTIKQLKALHTTSGAIDAINTDLVIRGIVVGDDRSGNLYKNIVIQDATGAIALLLDGTSLYNNFPIGREIFVKCKGLYLGDYNRMIQLGGGIDATGTTPAVADIPSALFTKYLVKGSLNNVVTPKVVTLADLSTNMQDTLLNVLVQLNNFEFATADTAKTFALPNQNPPGTANFTIRNCAAGSIILRNSGYANFAGFNVPNGNGPIVAMYTVFGNTRQLTIRDTSDVKFYNARCSAGGGGGGGGTGTGTGNILSENFESQIVPAAAPFNPIAITGWTNLSELGAKKFEARSFGTPINRYAQITAFGSGAANVTSWMVTGPVNLGTFTTKTLNFDSKAGFANGATLKVLVSTNFTGTGNPWDAAVTWSDITATAALSPGLATGYPTNFTSSGDVSLNAFTGTIYIAFKYEGADPTGSASDKTTTWQLDNLKVSGL